MNKLEETENLLIGAAAVIGAIYEMAEKADAVSISGAAACHTLLTSLEKNRKRTELLIMNPAREILEKRKNKLKDVDSNT